VQMGGSTEERVDAITPYKVARLASAVEGVLRCSNNLLERLHHSYFMYLQPNTNTFITIEAYVLPASLMLLGLFLLAVSLLMPTHNIQSSEMQQTCDIATGICSHAGGDADSPEAEAAVGEQKTYPQEVPRPIELLGGWPELSQGVCRVLAVHCTCGAAGLALHWGLAQHMGGAVPCCFAVRLQPLRTFSTHAMYA
jgi:hypothetical protein